MKLLMLGLAMSFSAFASDAKAEEMVTVDGVEYPLSILTKNCQSMSADPQAMIACFNALSGLLEQQGGGSQASGPSVPEALEQLRSVAEVNGNESGLLIAGADCKIQITYFGNYFHISRRNVSTVDLFNVEFDASKLEYDQFSRGRGSQVVLANGMMKDGETAATSGGFELDSSANGFASRSARASLADYAKEVVDQLPVTEGQAFDFVLVHPERSDNSTEIWGAFEKFVNACEAGSSALEGLVQG